MHASSLEGVCQLSDKLRLISRQSLTDDEGTESHWSVTRVLLASQDRMV